MKVATREPTSNMQQTCSKTKQGPSCGHTRDEYWKGERKLKRMSSEPLQRILLTAPTLPAHTALPPQIRAHTREPVRDYLPTAAWTASPSRPERRIRSSFVLPMRPDSRASTKRPSPEPPEGSARPPAPEASSAHPSNSSHGPGTHLLLVSPVNLRRS